MVFGLKDVIYILVYVISLVGVFFGAKSKLREIEKELKRNQVVIYGDKGCLNLVDTKSCKELRDHVYSTIRRGENVMDQTLKRIDELNTNVLTIMIYLQIKPPRLKNIKPVKGDDDVG